MLKELEMMDISDCWAERSALAHLGWSHSNLCVQEVVQVTEETDIWLSLPMGAEVIKALGSTESDPATPDRHSECAMSPGRSNPSRPNAGLERDV